MCVVVVVFTPPPLCCHLRFHNSLKTHLSEGFLLCRNFSSFTTPSPEWISVPKSFASVFFFYILSYFLSKRLGCFSGCLMSSSSIQKLFVEVSQHSNDLLMNLWGRKRTPILFLHHLGTTPILILNNYKVIREQTLYDLNNFKPHNFPPTFFYLFIYLYLFIFLYIWIYSCVS